MVSDDQGVGQGCSGPGERAITSAWSFHESTECCGLEACEWTETSGFLEVLGDQRVYVDWMPGSEHSFISVGLSSAVP